MQDTALKEKSRGKSVGLVPTMGALHEGHLSLVRHARAESDIAVASIFVNPIQFGAGEDFETYPRDLAADKEKLEKEGVDYLFAPEAQAMYPAGAPLAVVSVAGLSEKLCGPSRPGHFDGVATVVLKLFNIVQPTRAYFGLKDYQQSLIIRRLVKALDVPVEIVLCHTVREPDGLAMSSRNAYLSPAGRQAAPALYRALCAGEKMIKAGERKASAVRSAMREVLAGTPAITVEYSGVYDPETLEGPDEIEGPVLLALAAKIGRTRLIDNILINKLK